MSGKIFTYPITENLTEFEIDELVHYSAYRRKNEIDGRKLDVNVVIYNLSEEDIRKIKSIDSSFKIINVEDYLSDLNNFIGELYNNKKLNILKKKMYYCKNCNEYFGPDKIDFNELDIILNILKVRMGRRLYYIDKIPDNIEPVALAISDEDTLIYTKIDKETWVSPASMEKIWTNDLEIPKDAIKRGKLKDIRSKAKLVDYVITGNVKTNFVTKENIELYNPKNIISSYAVIYSLNTHVKKPVCPKCGAIVDDLIIPYLSINVNNKEIKISAEEGGYKIPLLYCASCQHIEYGTKIKDCPMCGNIMEPKFFYNIKIIVLGVYFSEMKDQNEIVFLHEKRQKWLYIDEVLSSLNIIFSKKVKILRHKFSNKMCKQAAYLTKRRGVVVDDIKKLVKIENALQNMIKYTNIYGKCEPKDIIDRWILSQNEKIKKEISDYISNGNFVHSFEILYREVVYEISRFYITMKRKEPLVNEVIIDAIKLLYIYDPVFFTDMLEKLNIESVTIHYSKVNEVKGIGVVREIIKKVMEFRNEREIPRREPLKKIIFVSEHAEELKEYSSRIMKFSNVLVFNATDKWDEMELTLEPNLDAINRMYRAWAPKIAFLLKRKNVKEVMSALDKGGYSMGIEGFIIKITPEMVKHVEKVPKGYLKIRTRYGDLFIYSERDITTMRIRMVNGIIRRINYMRKDLEMEYDDIIDVSISTDDYVMRILKGYADEIRERTRARNVDFKYVEYAYVVEWPVGDFDIIIGINPLFKNWVIKAFQSIPGIAENKAEMLFHMGYGSIYELMQASPSELAEIPGFSLNFANKTKDYLYSTAFKPKKEGGKETCPFCGVELSAEDEFCPRCGAPIRVKVEKKEVTAGNIYIAAGEFSKIVTTVLSKYADEKKLLITKDDPDSIKKEYNLKNTTVVWISYVPMGKSIKPKDINKLIDTIEKYIGKGVKIIMMDTFEFMLAINGIEDMINFLKQIREDVKSTKTVFMFNLEEAEEEYMDKISEIVDGKI